MLFPAITLDAAMSASAALARLARHGLWRDPGQPEAKAWIAQHAALVKRSAEQAAADLRRKPYGVGIAIRRQWYGHVLWYVRHAPDVLDGCASAPPDATLVVALGLREEDGRPPIDLPASGEAPSQEGVVLDRGTPVAVSVMLATAGRPRVGDGGASAEGGAASRSATRGAPGPRGRAAPAPAEVRAWPYVDAPQRVGARVPFEVAVGLGETQQSGVTGGQMTIPAPAGAAAVDVTVDLIADGVDAPDGWSRVLRVPVNDPASARVTFRLVGRDPAGPEPVHLTMIDVRYSVDGAVCGTASRPLVIGGDPATALPTPPGGAGTSWLAQPSVTTPFAVQPHDAAADLTIEFVKPDGNSAAGRFVCRCSTPHPVAIDTGPHQIDFGEDAKTFAKTIVERVRQYSDDPIVDNLLRSVGELVADKLPRPASDALRVVAQRVAPAPPSVLIISAEPYVPWELAVIDPPLDATRPPYLGAQALVGRWLRDSMAAPAAAAAGGAPALARIEKPPAQPPATIDVRHMAVMAGLYKAESGLQKLPSAEQEASSLTQTYDAVPLAASSQALKQLLDARLEHRFEQIGGPGAVHFAGHGDFDPSQPDASVLFLSDGRPLSSLLFRSAKYGGQQAPLIFLNACMIGIGGELLGDMGGFPGNCLRGGFGGLLGALWEVDDLVAGEIALEFWRRALPPAGGAAEPVAAVLRDLRAKYVTDGTSAPETTYLAYVYYGHPRLTLHRTS